MFEHTKPEAADGPPRARQGTVDLPYFDELLKMLGAGNGEIEQSFGRHVHWGYWERPEAADRSPEGFAAAAERLSQEICLAAEIRDGLSVLDAGCGFGGTLAHLNERYAKMQLTGLNLDHRQLERARVQVVAQSENRIEFLQGNACRLPFRDGSLDVVLAVECIFHFPSREAFFREVFRVLKQGGMFALSDFIPAKMIVPFAKIRLPQRLSRGFYGKCNVHHTLDAYRQLAANTGLTAACARDITRNTLPTYDYLKRLAWRENYINGYAAIETATLELLSRLELIRYFILAYRKEA